METKTVVKQPAFALAFAPCALAPISAWLEGIAVSSHSTRGLGGDHKRTYRRRPMTDPDFAPGT